MKLLSLLVPPACLLLACSGSQLETPTPGAGTASGTADDGTDGDSQPGLPPGAPGMDLPLDGNPIFAQFVRLTHQQWERSVRDVLRLDALPGLSESFTGDPPEGTFSNNERALLVTPNLSLDYQRAAAQLAERVARDSQALARLDGAGDAATFIASLGRRAYRRPLGADEQQRYQTLFSAAAEILGSGNAFADGAQLVIEAMLQSPHFVYRTELAESGAPLSGFEVASKLSFLLRNTTPDDTLLDAAAAGELSSAAGVVARAQQMLEEPEAAAVVARFHSELFGLDRYATIAKDPERFPEYTTELNPDLQRAEELLLNELYETGRGLADLLTSTRAYVNAQTAPLYGLTSATDEFEPVDLGPERAGFFTRLGFLAYNGTLRDPDSIHRGVEINRVILCAKLQPPAGVIPALPTIEAGQTNRERVNAHTGPGTCGEGCHATIINPIGFAFENFDAVGQLRDTDNGKPVETAGEYRFADGLKGFGTATELMQLIADSPQAHACFAEHLMQFGLGRDLIEDDRPLVEQLEGASLADSTSTKELLLAIVGAPSFSHRPAAAGGDAP